MENINQFEVKSVGKNLIDELKKAPVDTASIAFTPCILGIKRISMNTACFISTP